MVSAEIFLFVFSVNMLVMSALECVCQHVYVVQACLSVTFQQDQNKPDIFKQLGCVVLQAM